MATIEVRFPQLGMGVLEGEVVEWLVHVGASVTRGQTVAVIETGKSSVEVAATADGTRRLWPRSEPQPKLGMSSV